MDFSTRVEICSPEVLAEDFDGDIVILNLEDGNYFNLGKSAPQIWSSLMSGVTPQSLLEQVSKRRPDMADSVRHFITRLFELKLIRPADSDAEILVAPSIEWDELAATGAPEIDVFDDLANLILADPIHDVDADAGWPIRRSA